MWGAEGLGDQADRVGVVVERYDSLTSVNFLVIRFLWLENEDPTFEKPEKQGLRVASKSLVDTPYLVGRI